MYHPFCFKLGFAQLVVISNDTLGQTGGSVLLVCTGYSKPHNSSTIMWLKDNQELTNSTTVNITLEDTEQGGRQFRSSYLRLCELQRSSSGNYTCTVSSEDKSTNSTVNLYVQGRYSMQKFMINIYQLTSDVLEHKWRASLKTILFLYE